MPLSRKKQKHHSVSGLADLAQCLGVAEICACMEIDACQPVCDSTLTVCMRVRVRVVVGTHGCACGAVTNELCLIRG